MVTNAPVTQQGAAPTPDYNPLSNQDTISGREEFLNSDPRLEVSNTLKKGSAGPEVFNLQGQLNDYLIAHGEPRIKRDGVFGEKTKGAVEKVQESLNSELKISPPLKVDGVWGTKSEHALEQWKQLQREAVTAGMSPGAKPALTFTQEGYHRGKPYSFEAKEVLDVEGGRFTMSAPTADAFEKMRAAAANDGITLKINSAFRTNEEQAKLRRDWEAGVGNPANRPGHSDHQSGFAVDIRLREDPAVLGWLDKNGGRFGFDRPKQGQIENGRKVSNEPWHWEYVPERERLQGKVATR